MKDPSYLRHLGDLATLKNFIGGYYYQTVWEDFASHEAIWNLYIHETEQDGLQVLVEQIETLLHEEPRIIFQVLEREIGLGGVYFNHSHEAIAWLEQCQAYMQAAIDSSSDCTDFR
jgi:hypothetical protein